MTLPKNLTLEMALAIISERALKAAVRSAETQEPIAPGFVPVLEVIEKGLGHPFDEELFVSPSIEDRVEAARHDLRHPRHGRFVPVPTHEGTGSAIDGHPHPLGGSAPKMPWRHSGNVLLGAPEEN